MSRGTLKFEHFNVINLLHSAFDYCYFIRIFFFIQFSWKYLQFFATLFMINLNYYIPNFSTDVIRTRYIVSVPCSNIWYCLYLCSIEVIHYLLIILLHYINIMVHHHHYKYKPPIFIVIFFIIEITIHQMDHLDWHRVMQVHGLMTLPMMLPTDKYHTIHARKTL